MANPEVNKPIPLSEVPQHWKFEERNLPIDVAQTEPMEGYLSFNLRLDKLAWWSRHRVVDEYGFLTDSVGNPIKAIDYMFDQEGNPIAKREAHAHSVFIEYFSENTQIDFQLEGAREKVDDLFNNIRLFLRRSSGESDDFLVDQAMYGSHFENRVVRIEMGDFMLREGKFIELPELQIYPLANKKNREDYPETNPTFTVEKETEGIFFINANGEKEFLTDWDIVTEEDKAGKEVSFVVVSQLHIPTGDRKVLRTPLQLDMQKIIDIMHGRFSYKRNSEGKLYIPWADMDREVGFGVGYLRKIPSSQAPASQGDVLQG